MISAECHIRNGVCFLHCWIAMADHSAFPQGRHSDIINIPNYYNNSIIQYIVPAASSYNGYMDSYASILIFGNGRIGLDVFNGTIRQAFISIAIPS